MPKVIEHTDSHGVTWIDFQNQLLTDLWNELAWASDAGAWYNRRPEIDITTGVGTHEGIFIATVRLHGPVEEYDEYEEEE